ncbi:MAG: glycosyltransferase family 4 protein [Cyanobacteria bacterium J06634_6]
MTRPSFSPTEPATTITPATTTEKTTTAYLAESVVEGAPIEDFKQQFQVEGPLLMYVGNLESYQGIDLMLASFAQVLPKAPTAHLIVIGGSAKDIAKYKAQTQQQQTENNVHLIGPRPVGNLKHYLSQADIVVSPRTQGENTPMKLYSYLDSGKALLATNLVTHTQVCNDQIAMLADPTVHDFANGILQLIDHPQLRAKLGVAARAFIEKEHTFEVLSRKLSSLYNWLDSERASDKK